MKDGPTMLRSKFLFINSFLLQSEMFSTLFCSKFYVESRYFPLFLRLRSVDLGIGKYLLVNINIECVKSDTDFVNFIRHFFTYLHKSKNVFCNFLYKIECTYRNAFFACVRSARTIRKYDHLSSGVSEL